MNDIAVMIEREVLSWPSVTAHPHRFGGIAFRIGHREIGHLHGGRLAERFIAARLAGMSLRRLRQLERQGLVKPATRTLGGCPLYALSQLEDIRKADGEASATACLEAGERN